MSDETQERWPVTKHVQHFSLRQDVDTLLANLAREMELSKAELLRRIVLGWLSWDAGQPAGVDEDTRLGQEGWDGQELTK